MKVSTFSSCLVAGSYIIRISVFSQCYKSEEFNSQCPVCSKPFNELSNPLPFSHCSQSYLICSLSGQPMNEHNPPMALPNGYIYGEQVRKRKKKSFFGIRVLQQQANIIFVHDYWVTYYGLLDYDISLNSLYSPLHN